MRYCPKCLEDKHDDEFSSAKARWCKACKKEYDSNRFIQNRETILDGVTKIRHKG